MNIETINYEGKAERKYSLREKEQRSYKLSSVGLCKGCVARYSFLNPRIKNFDYNIIHIILLFNYCLINILLIKIYIYIHVLYILSHT